MKIKSGHTLTEDIFSILQAVLVFSIAILFFKSGGLIIGGTSGIALLLSYTTDVNFSWWFVICNSPFFILALLRMGVQFTIYTIISVVAVSFIVDNSNHIIQINIANQFVSAILGGLFAGIGMIMLFRHRSSIGGLNILALYLQDKKIISAGKFQLLVDTSLVIACFYLFDLITVIASALALAIVNVILIVNHKEGRYSPNRTK